MQTTLPFLEQTPAENSFDSILFSAGEKNLTIELSNRMKKSWRITKRGKQFIVTAPAKFDETSIDVKKALIEWSAILKSTNLSRKMLTSDEQLRLKELESHLWKSLHGDIEIARHVQYTSPHIKFKDSFGQKFDLNEQFSKLNELYFNNELTSFLRWGQHGSKTSYHTIIVDELNAPHHLITIAGLYNHPSVPEYALNGVLYHEMCHIAAPPKEGALRRNVHHREFRLLEKRYPYYTKWQMWLKKDAQKLIRRVSRFRK